MEQWRVVHELTIGGADSGPASFTSISSVAPNAEGQILVLENETQQIELFDSSGTHLRSIGRKGQGPGEFTRANGFRIAPDGAIWVNNPRNNRITIFNADGSLRKEIPLRINSYSIREWEAWFDGDTLRELIDGRRDTTTIYLIQSFPDGGSRIDTMPAPCDGLLPRFSRDNIFIINHDRGGSTSFPIPWTATKLRLFDGHGHSWCGASDHYQLTRIDLSGTDTVVLRGNRQPSPVTARDRDSITAMIRRVALKRLGLPDPDWSRIPAVKPIIESARTDDQGRVWIQVAVDGPGQQWDVFSMKGVQLAEVRSEVTWSRWGPMTIRGDLMYGVIMDSNDVMQVVRARIQRQ